MIELNNELVNRDEVPEELAKNFLKLLSPFAPHVCEEIWAIADFGNEELAFARWPEAKEELAVAETVEIAVQVNGKLRARFDAEAGLANDEVEALALAQENVQAHVGDKTPRKVIVVPDKLVNVVV